MVAGKRFFGPFLPRGLPSGDAVTRYRRTTSLALLLGNLTNTHCPSLAH